MMSCSCFSYSNTRGVTVTGPSLGPVTDYRSCRRMPTPRSQQATSPMTVVASRDLLSSQGFALPAMPAMAAISSPFGELCLASFVANMRTDPWSRHQISLPDMVAPRSLLSTTDAMATITMVAPSPGGPSHAVPLSPDATNLVGLLSLAGYLAHSSTVHLPISLAVTQPPCCTTAAPSMCPFPITSQLPMPNVAIFPRAS
jgi:hypothetical protein